MSWHIAPVPDAVYTNTSFFVWNIYFKFAKHFQNLRKFSTSVCLWMFLISNNTLSGTRMGPGID